MGLFQRVEQKLEKAVNGAFAKAFRADVQPVEIASAIRRAMDDRAAVLGRGRTIVPNLFTIELSDNDYERLTEYEEDLEIELIAAAEEHADTQRYQPGGPLQVSFESAPDLETGVFRVRPSTARHPAGRPQTRRPEPEPQHEPWQDWDDDEDGPGGYAAAGGAAAAAYAAGRRSTRRPVHEPSAGHDEREHDYYPHSARRPNPSDRPWLDVDGERYPLMGPITVIGRDDEADIILDDPGISRRHCEIRVTTDGPHLVASIRDLQSTNGTFVSGERISSQRLQDGDRITVGRTSVTFRAGRR
jgi:hypothetical protein